MQKYYLSFLCFISSGIFLAACDLTKHKTPLLLNSKASTPTKEVPKPSVVLPASGGPETFRNRSLSPEGARCKNQYVLTGIDYAEKLTRTDTGVWARRILTVPFSKLLQGKIIWVIQEFTERQGFTSNYHPDRFVATTSKSYDPTVHRFEIYHLKRQLELSGLRYTDYSRSELDPTTGEFTYPVFIIPVNTDSLDSRDYIIPKPTIPEGEKYEPQVHRRVD